MKQRILPLEFIAAVVLSAGILLDAKSAATKPDYANEVLTVKGRGIRVANVIRENSTTLTLLDSSGKEVVVEKSDILQRQNVYEPDPDTSGKRKPEEMLPPGSGLSPLDFYKEAQRRLMQGDKQKIAGDQPDEVRKPKISTLIPAGLFLIVGLIFMAGTYAKSWQKNSRDDDKGEV